MATRAQRQAARKRRRRDRSPAQRQARGRSQASFRLIREMKEAQRADEDFAARMQALAETADGLAETIQMIASQPQQLRHPDKWSVDACSCPLGACEHTEALRS